MGFDWVHLGEPDSTERAAASEAAFGRFVEAARRRQLNVMTDFHAPPSAPGHKADSANSAGTRLRQTLGLGVAGFVCRQASLTPAASWRELLADARGVQNGVRFIADTLGTGTSAASDLAAAGFDYFFNSSRWWDFRSEWLMEEQAALSRLTPTISFPEAPDAELAAAGGKGSVSLKAIVECRLLFAATFSGGWMMPGGCEFGFHESLDLMFSKPDRWGAPRLDLSEYVAALNTLRARHAGLDIETPVRRISAPGGQCVALLRLAGGHPLAADEAFLMVLNADPLRALSMEPGCLLSETGGLLGPFVDETPCRVPMGFEPGRPLVFEPLELRFFHARRGERPLQPDGTAQRHSIPGPPSNLGSRRIIIEGLKPQIDGGRHPAKRIVGDMLEIEADIFMDGHVHLGACVRCRFGSERGWREIRMEETGNDRWRARIPLTRIGSWFFTVEAWLDEFESWRADTVKKHESGQNIDLDLREGLDFVRSAAGEATGADRKAWQELLAAGKSETEADDAMERAARLLLSEELSLLMRRSSPRRVCTRHPAVLTVIVDRPAARFSAWYELFPRSQSPEPGREGTFDDVIARLPYVRDLGFDVVYFPPIHPIGRTNRKGRNNSPTAAAGDPGSPYAIGSVEGGHEAIHPGLGDFADFHRLVQAAHAEGLEIALDFAIQCSPDHPWLNQHPDWFDWRVDGSLRYAENPPKRYEDIVNVDFEKGLPTLWLALRDVVLFWAQQGVRIFRVDNPHTKPVPFWEWMLAQLRERYPDTIFLSEAFTRPKMMKKLAKVGFSQSYTYFTWRNSKSELTEYFTELCQGPSHEYLRPNLFANTPDINPLILQTGGRAAFMMRAALAATLSSAYGIYSGYELCESAALSGREEYLNSEKYEIRRRDWDQPGNIRSYISVLNRIRRDNPALHDFCNLRFYNAFDNAVLLYGKMTESRDNFLLIAVNLDPHTARAFSFELPLWEFGLADHDALQIEDLFSGASWQWRGKLQQLRLDPAVNPAAIWRLSLLSG